MTPVEIIRGTSPIVLGLPHTGTHVPDDIFSNLTPLGQTLSDTDWHIHRLYADLLEDVTSVRATFHRYVIDANRDPMGESLYPGQNTTGLVPLTDFDGQPIWIEEPDEAEVKSRLETYHSAYHNALAQELNRVKQQHGVAILYDCHSIRSNIPFLFEGTLLDFNVGTANGKTCSPIIESVVYGICQSASPYSSVLNGRFKGGWTTRHYGQPQDNIHAIQMELAQSTHLVSEEVPFEYDPQKAEGLRVYLSSILKTLADMASSVGAHS